MEHIVLFGFCVQQLGLFAYLRDTLRGQSQPNRVSFFLWSLAPFIGVAAALSDGVTWAALPVFAAGFGPFLVFLASFVNKKAYWKITGFDWACAALSVAALILWQITKNPAVAIAFAVLADGAAALPVIRKSWTHPHSETAVFYLAAAFNQVTAFLAMKHFNFVEMAFPVYLLSACLILFTLITIGQRMKPLAGKA
jgi:hypothetical protein